MTREAEGLPAAPPAVRLAARAGAPPLGAIFGMIGLVSAATVWLLGLDRMPFSLCLFRGLTGLPCPTCGSTRALGRLFALDFAGALRMNPFTTLVAVVVAAWAAADLALLPRRQALGLEVSRRVAFGLRVAALVLFLANWVYLVAAGR
ncbi:MAG TPA: DUF2752 domain-containing protein [Vicinamibacteria bacterium]|nr:DUF2752 domain-containing protein [Vicinamibacteria bacterium]